MESCKITPDCILKNTIKNNLARSQKGTTMDLTISPGKALHGSTRLPGDKSLSHRAALFAALAEGESVVENFLISGVTQAMLAALTALEVPWRLEGQTLSISGKGYQAFAAPSAAIHCGNSATTLRLLAGALSASGVPAVLDGSDGLRRRPMDRIVAPLQLMGVPIYAGENGCAPLQLKPRRSSHPLNAVIFDMPTASAQVKTCLILAALAADGPTTLTEPALSRDHTERMLRSMGATVQNWSEAGGRACLTLTPPAEPLTPLRMTLPGDPSAAAFLIVAALIAPDSELFLPGVLLNPTRTGLLEALWAMGAQIEISGLHEQNAEPVGDLTVCTSRLHGTRVQGSQVVDMIDEFPAFAIAAAFAQGKTEVRQAEELRYKESDRITAVVNGLNRLGVAASENPDGFIIEGKGAVPGGCRVAAQGDHRLGMSFALAGLAANAPITVEGAEIISESFPDFAGTLRRLGADVLSEDRKL
jgi:3-phosphoshikimate 1-carboxyvinyltransferase